MIRRLAGAEGAGKPHHSSQVFVGDAAIVVVVSVDLDPIVDPTR
jgi:hypothetical protein